MKSFLIFMLYKLRIRFYDQPTRLSETVVGGKVPPFGKNTNNNIILFLRYPL